MGGRGRGRGRGRQGQILCGKITGVAPGERFETEVEDAVEFVEGDAHVKTGFGGGEAIATGLLHDGQGFEIEPADGGGVDGFDGDGFHGFEAGAERGDAIFDEVEASALHDVVLVVVGGGDDFFRDAEGGADFGAGEFAVFEELEIHGGEFGGEDFGIPAPRKLCADWVPADCRPGPGQRQANCAGVWSQPLVAELFRFAEGPRH
jgi:hypothetical protein